MDRRPLPLVDQGEIVIKLSVAARKTIAIVFVVCVVVVLISWVDWTAQVKMPIILTVCAIGATLTNVVMTRHPVGAAIPVATQRAFACQQLAEAMMTRWTAEANTRGLNRHVMAVRWQWVPRSTRPGEQHQNLGLLRHGARTDAASSFVTDFYKLEKGRVILRGDPGAGKTTFALQILLELLRLRGESEPVPVLVSLSGWNLDKYPTLRDWLAFRLSQDFPSLNSEQPDMAYQLVETNMVLPILDGIDENSIFQRTRLLQALNATLSERDQLILTFRTAEYEETIRASEYLASAVVLEAVPLTMDDAIEYLDGFQTTGNPEDWTEFYREIRNRPNGALAEVCQNPLGLWLIASVYGVSGSTPSELAIQSKFRTVEEIKHRLFVRLVSSLHGQRSDGSRLPAKNRHKWDTEKIESTLSYFARHMNGSSDIRWWHLPAARVDGLPGSGSGLFFGITIGLLLGLAAAFTSGVAAGVVIGVIVGIGSAIAFGRASHLVPEPGVANLQVRGRVRPLSSALGIEVSYYACLIISVWLVNEISNSLIVAIIIGGVGFRLGFGIIFGWSVGLASWVRSSSADDLGRTPRSSRRDSFMLSTVVGLSAGVVFGVSSGLAVSSEYNWQTSVLVGILVGVSFALIGGLSVDPAWLNFFLTSVWLAIRRKAPWRLMNFLEYLHNLGLLRMDGSSYQFRHRDFEEYFFSRC